MKRTVSRFSAAMAGLLFQVVFLPLRLSAGTVQLDVGESRIELSEGLSTTAWTYNGSVPGAAVVADAGERMTIRVTNRLPVPTNIHWHGLVVPASQDGPGIYIGPGETWTYSFSVNEPGTYWYHSHYRPALEQVDRGLYGAFIVREPSDSLYTSDSVFVLDDWLLNADGTRIEGTPAGLMERIGNIETVNGKTGGSIPQLHFTKGELHKFRFINASTAAVHTLKISGHVFRVTHLDGHSLAEPYLTDTVTLSPGERVDAEVAATGRPGAAYEITGNDGKRGMKIGIVYSGNAVAPVASPFIRPSRPGFRADWLKGLDAVLVFDSASVTSIGPDADRVRLGSGGREPAGSSSTEGKSPDPVHGGSAASATPDGTGGMAGDMNMGGTMRWTINGKSYPDTDPVTVKTGKLVKLRLQNADTKGPHPMDHPVHLHGTVFQVLSVNGKAPERDLWKDTVTVRAGEYVDIAFFLENPGNWMIHCHIFDHEDGGMITLVRAR